MSGDAKKRSFGFDRANTVVALRPNWRTSEVLLPEHDEKTTVMPSERPVKGLQNLDTAKKIPLPDAPSKNAARSGKVYAVFACKGGVGGTTLAVNLATMMAASARGSVIVDLDLQLGDVLCALNLTCKSTIAELLEDIDSLDASALRRRLALHKSGVCAIAQASRFEQLEALKPDRIPNLIAGLGRHFDSVILDGLHDFSDLSISSLDMADKILMVLTQDIPAVRSATRCLELFRRLGYPDEKVVVVVNRFQQKSSVTREAISEALEIPVSAVVANDFRLVESSVNQGVPLPEAAPQAKVTQDIRVLRGRLDGTQDTDSMVEGVEPSSKGGFWKTLFGRGQEAVKK